MGNFDLAESLSMCGPEPVHTSSYGGPPKDQVLAFALEASVLVFTEVHRVGVQKACVDPKKWLQNLRSAVEGLQEPGVWALTQVCLVMIPALLSRE